MERTRSFIAINSISPAIEAISQVIRSLQSEVRHVKWIQPAQAHLTIKFLGDIDNRDIPSVCRSMEDACQGIAPFTVSLGGVGTFPARGKPRVVWLGVGGDCEPLLTIHGRLDEALREFGVRREGRAFRPHITIGRPTNDVEGEELAAILANFNQETVAEMEVDEVHLVASILDRQGPTHENMHTVSLA